MSRSRRGKYPWRCGSTAGGEAPLRSWPKPSPVKPEKETIAAWSGYAKDRFDYASKRLDEFRNWARQLVGIIGVTIGFELTLVGRALDMKTSSRGWLTLVILLLLVAVATQIYLFVRSVHTGYSVPKVLGPERATTLAEHIVALDERETKRVLGAYYAKSADDFHAASESAAADLNRIRVKFGWTLLPLAAGLVGTVVLGLAAYTDTSMVKSASTASPVATPTTVPTMTPTALTVPAAVPSPPPTAASTPVATVTPLPAPSPSLPPGRAPSTPTP